MINIQYQLCNPKYLLINSVPLFQRKTCNNTELGRSPLAQGSTTGYNDSVWIREIKMTQKI